ncbi:MAG: ABC transporter substrate-binding protein [Clostridia bacterium]|nr:ABC transporter substrate-binding protein [Clostridia bacterium]
MKKLLSILLALSMLAGMTTAFAEDTAAVETPIVVAIQTLSSKFSPFFADTGYDQDVVEMTQVPLMTTDRTGGIIFNGIEGETVSYNGTDYFYQGIADLSQVYDKEADITTYTAKLADNIKFSDGTQMTADDIIFNYYVYLDPSYTGSTTLGSYDIVGLQAYLTQVPEDSLAAVVPAMDALKAAGAGYTVTEADPFTQEVYDAYQAGIVELWKADTQGITDYVFDNYAADYAEAMLGKTADEVAASEGLKTALGMALWGFGEISEDFATVTTAAGETIAVAEATNDDYYEAAAAKYAGDFTAYLDAGESATGTTLDALNASTMSAIAAASGVDMSAGVPNITGIRKLDDLTVEVKVNGFSAPAIYTILGIQIAPMHYYGDGTYDYEANNFGHPYGDLSCMQDKLDKPMGAGPYKFVKYENRVVYYEANEHYYLGAPATKNFQFKETNSAEVCSAVQTGTVDGGSDVNGSKANFEMLRSFNSNGELVGDVVTTYSVANLGYGYIGINADTVNVAGEPASEASKNLRKAIATVMSVYRDVAFDSYYGDAASVINYPISSTSWAAPQATDEGYRVAFSVDVDGNPIFTADMDAPAKYAAALEASKGFFKAAGYTFDEATGMMTAAPEGAKLSYEVIIPADGIGDHPSFAILTDAKNALATIGFELKINDPADSNVLWDSMDAGVHEMWCAAWGSTIDPDMYQVYHSSNIVGLGGSDSNHYHIRSEELDQMILDARASEDQAYRKEVYRACLDEIMDWAVEIPAYQRQNIALSSSVRVDTATVTPDVTTYWGWLMDSQNIVMNMNK